MNRVFALAAVAAGLVAAPAVAQDNTAPGGLYVGALGGYEGIDVESSDGSVSADADSAVYGVAAGYDLSLGSAFVGIEGDQVFKHLAPPKFRKLELSKNHFSSQPAHTPVT